MMNCGGSTLTPSFCWCGGMWILHSTEHPTPPCAGPELWGAPGGVPSPRPCPVPQHRPHHTLSVHPQHPFQLRGAPGASLQPHSLLHPGKYPSALWPPEGDVRASFSLSLPGSVLGEEPNTRQLPAPPSPILTLHPRNHRQIKKKSTSAMLRKGEL